MKIWPWVFVVIAICGRDAPAPRAQGSAAGPLRIGFLTGMSGPNSVDVGPGGVAAARMAIFDFGGNVLGRTVELLVGDHQNKSDVGLLIARKWYAQDGVEAIMDASNSAVALAVQQLLAIVTV